MKVIHYILLGLITGAVLGWIITHADDYVYYASPSYANAVSRAAPAVVNIYTTKKVTTVLDERRQDNDFFFQQQQQRLQQKRQLSLGSGVIMHADGFIVTNYHVIRDAEEILVLLYDGRDALARIVGIDRETDLAVLKIDLPNLSAISPAKNDRLRVGDPALAIGNPFGFGQSVTAGIISAVGRYGLNLNTYENFIQTDAAINIGNSGGALINHRGELIGINAAIYSQNGSAQGIGLAIPTDIVSKVMRDIVRYGQVIRGWLGLEVTQLNSSLAQRLGIRQTSGVLITSTYHQSPADVAGLLPGDVIISINNKHIDSGQEGLLEVANLAPGKSVVVEIIRDNQTQIVPIIVGIRPATPD